MLLPRAITITLIAITLTLLYGCSGSSSSNPSTPNTTKPTNNPPLLQENDTHYILGGDGLLDKNDPALQPYIQALLTNDATSSGTSQGFTTTSFRSQSIQLWPNGEIPYYIAEGFSNSELTNIETAIWEWTKAANLKFIKRTHWEPYVYLIQQTTSTENCGYSTLGRQAQAVLQLRCNDFGIILHEFGHGIGLLHEHQRYDRDDFVEILWDQMPASVSSSNYALIPEHLFLNPHSTTIGDYDFDSIMHYGPSYIDAGENSSRIGQRLALSAGDKAGAQQLYGTSKVPQTNPTGNRVTEAFESPHPYANNTTISHTFHQPGAQGMKVNITRLNLEDGNDKLLIKDRNGDTIHIYTGSYLTSFTTLPVIGDRITIELVSDATINDFGIIIEGYSWF